MADITLSIAAEIDGSISNAQSVLNSIKSQIEGIPKVKIEVDNSSLNGAKSSVDSIVNSLKSAGSSGTTSSINKLNSAMQATATAAGKTTTATENATNASLEHSKTIVKTSNSEKAATVVTNEYVNAQEKKKVKVQQSIKADGELGKTIKTVTQEYETSADKQRQAEAWNKKLTAAQKTQNGILTKGTRYLNEYTKAANSSNAGSQSAYQSISNIVDQAKGVSLSGDSVTQTDIDKINSLNSALQQSAATIEINGDNTKSWSDRIGEATSKFSSWFTISQAIILGTQAIKNMVSETIQLDTAMTELKKVTDESDSTYDKFLSNAADRATNVGAELSDVVTATADFARLGYTIDEASELADAAAIYKNVGDGLEDVSEASESIISTMQAFGIEATDAMSIVDKFNEVGNNFAISSSGIGEALQRSASSLSAAGNTIDESIALVTAANEVVQNPETVGRHICPTIQ